MLSLGSLFANPTPDGTETALFAGGCFWCMEKPFDRIDGVISVTAGYTGGRVVNPTYEEVCTGATGHAEAVEVVFDPAKVDYETLLDIFWRNIDPTDPAGQFCDKGTQYRTAVFYTTARQRELAEASKQAHAESGRFPSAIVTEIVEADPFYPAEEYHQKYYRTHPDRYDLYRAGSGRDRRLAELWGTSGTEPPVMDDAQRRKELSPEAYHVLREEGTERAGSSPLNGEHRKGTYRCAGCGAKLFTSEMKFDSGTGWPSFFATVPGAFETKTDRKLFMPRTEYHCARCGGHHGHLFDDGPQPTGKRYCNNGAALTFEPDEGEEKDFHL